jgi:hypothetical protein
VFCSCAFVFAVVHLFFHLCYFFAVVPFFCSCANFLYDSYIQFCSCAIYFAVVHFFLQLSNFFSVVQFFWQLYNLLPDPMRFWTMLKRPKLRRSGTKKRGPSWVIPLSLVTCGTIYVVLEELVPLFYSLVFSQSSTQCPTPAKPPQPHNTRTCE